VRRAKKSHSVRNAAKCLALVATAGLMNESEIQLIGKKKKVKKSESSKKSDSSRPNSEDERKKLNNFLKSDSNTEKKNAKLTKLKIGSESLKIVEGNSVMKCDALKSIADHNALPTASSSPAKRIANLPSPNVRSPAEQSERIIEFQKFFGSADVGDNNFLLPNIDSRRALSPRILESSGAASTGSFSSSLRSTQSGPSAGDVTSDPSKSRIRKVSANSGTKGSSLPGSRKTSTNGVLEDHSSVTSLNEKENSSFEELLDVFERESTSSPQPMGKLIGSKKKPLSSVRSTGLTNDVEPTNNSKTAISVPLLPAPVRKKYNKPPTPEILVSAADCSSDDTTEGVGLVAARVQRFSGMPRSGSNYTKNHLAIGGQRAGGGLSRVESIKLSHAITRKMSRRQKRELMMESEFDEFDEIEEASDKKIMERIVRRRSTKKKLGLSVPLGTALLASSESSLVESTADSISLASLDQPVLIQPMGHAEENAVGKIQALPGSDVDSDDEWMDVNIPLDGHEEESSGSDNSDCAFEEKIVVQLNIQRLQVSDYVKTCNYVLCSLFTLFESHNNTEHHLPVLSKHRPGMGRETMLLIGSTRIKTELENNVGTVGL